ncbi:MAG: hypothetical protein IKY87_03240 [Paludibacteraceae bacterium]|nr:hypothetical protein [Paludibacteraceae bacterium]
MFYQLECKVTLFFASEQIFLIKIRATALKFIQRTLSLAANDCQIIGKVKDGTGMVTEW